MSTPDERLAHAKEIIQTYNVLHGLVVSSFPEDTPLPPLTTRQMNLLISVKERDGISIKDLADLQGVTTVVGLDDGGSDGRVGHSDARAQSR